jgi:hypothetical protein
MINTCRCSQAGLCAKTEAVGPPASSFAEAFNARGALAARGHPSESGSAAEALL